MICDFGMTTTDKIRKNSKPDPASRIAIRNKTSSPGDILNDKMVTVKDPLGVMKDSLPQEYRGSISIAKGHKTEVETNQLEQICAAKAIEIKETGKPQRNISVDMGKCILCGRCQEFAPELFQIGSSFKPAVKNRRDLFEPSTDATDQDQPSKIYEQMGQELKAKIRKIFGRSLAIREVDAGSCNGCEIEITALNNAIYDIERFGIHFVASPRHADLLLVTGPASRNMEIALKRTYDATPDPKLVVAVGACACSGGIFGDTYATTGGIDKVVPVDVYIPGCPPRPEAILYGLLLAVDRIASDERAESRIL